MSNDLFSVSELALYLRISERTVRQLIAEKTIPYIRAGRRILIRKPDIDRFLRQGMVTR